MVSAFDCSVIKYAQITFLGGLCRRITKTSRCREEAKSGPKGGRDFASSRQRGPKGPGP